MNKYDIDFWFENDFLSIKTENKPFSLFISKLDLFTQSKDEIWISLISKNQIEDFIEIFDFLKDKADLLNLSYTINIDLNLYLNEKASTLINL